MKQESKRKIIHVKKDFIGENEVEGGPLLLAIYLEKIEGLKNEYWYYSQERYGDKEKHRGIKGVKKSPLRLFFDLINSDSNVVILYHFGVPLLVLISILLKLKGTKCITSADLKRGNFYIHETRKNIFNTLKMKLAHLLYSIQSHFSDKIWLRTSAEAELLKKLPWPPDIQSKAFFYLPGHNFEIGKEEKENFIMSASTHWEDLKNLHAIIEVFSKVREEVEDIQLVIIGEFAEGLYPVFDEKTELKTGNYERGEDYKKKIKKMVDELDLNEKVKFVGIKTGKELEKLFKKAKIYYLPSKSESVHRGYLQAMASGTPQVARRLSSVKHVIDDGKTGFLRNSKEGQKKAILRLLKDNELYEEMQKHCLEKARKYTWEKVAEKWKEVLLEMD